MLHNIGELLHKEHTFEMCSGIKTILVNCYIRNIHLR